MTWACRECGSKAGYQPFADVGSVTFWMLNQGSPGSVPPVWLQLNNPDIEKACNAKLDMSTITPDTKQADGWMKYTIPMQTFDCPNPEQMNQLLWNTKEGLTSNIQMCLDNVQINRPGAPTASPAAPAAAGRRLLGE
eukprot:GHRR01015006.1.p1 GENE.GHRR01015006.1~~GHRR01015006.1.p1  ORF type:complete len:137 (-),score=33.38 GHRR01015006.1:2934-3344(-)